VSWRLVGGDTAYLTKDGDLLKTSTTDPTLVGEYNHQIEVFYSVWAEPTTPTQILTVDFKVTIEPTCQESPFVRLSAVQDLSTPMTTSAYQDITTLFSHQYEAIWPMGACTVNWRIVGGDKPFLVQDGDSMKLYTPELTYVGTHSVQLEVYYSAWTEPVEPTRTQTIDLTVTIEAPCEYISYLPDSAFVVPADIRQIIFDV